MLSTCGLMWPRHSSDVAQIGSEGPEHDPDVARMSSPLACQGHSDFWDKYTADFTSHRQLFIYCREGTYGAGCHWEPACLRWPLSKSSLEERRGVQDSTGWLGWSQRRPAIGGEKSAGLFLYLLPCDLRWPVLLKVTPGIEGHGPELTHTEFLERTEE